MDSFFSMNIMFAWQIFIEKAFSFADGPHHYPGSSKFLFPYSTEEYVAERSFQRTCSSDTPPMGFEPTTFELEVQRAIRCATAAMTMIWTCISCGPVTV